MCSASTVHAYSEMHTAGISFSCGHSTYRQGVVNIGMHSRKKCVQNTKETIVDGTAVVITGCIFLAARRTCLTWA